MGFRLLLLVTPRKRGSQEALPLHSTGPPFQTNFSRWCSQFNFFCDQENSETQFSYFFPTLIWLNSMHPPVEHERKVTKNGQFFYLCAFIAQRRNRRNGKSENQKKNKRSDTCWFPKTILETRICNFAEHNVRWFCVLRSSIAAIVIPNKSGMLCRFL